MNPPNSPSPLTASAVGLRLSETTRCRRQSQSEPLEFPEMKGGQRLQLLGSDLGESQRHESTVGLVSRAQDEPRCIRSIDEFDDVVMAQR